jgi:hypothetical protein
MEVVQAALSASLEFGEIGEEGSKFQEGGKARMAYMRHLFVEAGP